MLARSRRGIKLSQPMRAAGALAHWAPAATWMGGIFYLSHQAAPLGAAVSTAESVIAHLGLYAGLALLLLWALRLAGSSRRDFWALSFVAFALTVLYGVSDEVHQAYVPGRSASEADIALDAAGALTGLVLAFLAAAWRRRRS